MATINFPNNPVDNEKFTLNGEVWVFNTDKNQWLKNLQTDNSVEISFPEVPEKVSDLTNDAAYLSSINSAQIITALGYTPVDSLLNISAATYTDEASFPESGNTVGDIVFSNTTKRLYFWNGTAFVAIAYVNDSPNVSGLLSEYELDITEDPITINLLVEEPQNQAVTVAAEISTNNYNISVIAAAGETSEYTLRGRTFTGINGENSTIYMYVGDTLNLYVNAPNNPLWIKNQNSIGEAGAIGSVINNGSENNTIQFTPTSTGTYYYNSQFNLNMDGEIVVSARPNPVTIAVEDTTITITPVLYNGAQTYKFIISDGNATTILSSNFIITSAIKYPENLYQQNSTMVNNSISSSGTSSVSNYLTVLKDFNINPGNRNYIQYGTNVIYGFNDDTSSTYAWSRQILQQNPSWQLNSGINWKDGAVTAGLSAPVVNYPYYAGSGSYIALWSDPRNSPPEGVVYTSTNNRSACALVKRNDNVFLIKIRGGNYDIDDLNLAITTNGVINTPLLSRSDAFQYDTNTGIVTNSNYSLNEIQLNETLDGNTLLVDNRYILFTRTFSAGGSYPTVNEAIAGDSLIAIHDLNYNPDFDLPNFPNIGNLETLRYLDLAKNHSYRIVKFMMTDDLQYFVVAFPNDLIVYDWSNKSSIPVHSDTRHVNDDLLFNGDLATVNEAIYDFVIYDNIIYVLHGLLLEVASYQIDDNGQLQQLDRIALEPLSGSSNIKPTRLLPYRDVLLTISSNPNQSGQYGIFTSISSAAP